MTLSVRYLWVAPADLRQWRSTLSAISHIVSILFRPETEHSSLAPARAARSLQFNPETLRDPVHERVVRSDSADVVNADVIETVGSKIIDILARDGGRRVGQPDHVVEHRAVSRTQLRLTMIRLQRAEQCIRLFARHPLRFQQLTETRSVMVNSVLAGVLGGHRHRDHLALDPAQRPRSIHEFAVQLVVQLGHLAVHGMNPENVVVIRNAVFRGHGVGRQIFDERHGLLSGGTFPFRAGSHPSLRRSGRASRTQLEQLRAGLAERV